MESLFDGVGGKERQENSDSCRGRNESVNLTRDCVPVYRGELDVAVL